MNKEKRILLKEKKSEYIYVCDDFYLNRNENKRI